LPSARGQTAARSILGRRERFDAVPFFWTEQYDFGLAYVGHAENWDKAEIDGQLDARDCTITYRREGRKLAVAVIHRDLQRLCAEVEFEGAIASAKKAVMPRSGRVNEPTRRLSLLRPCHLRAERGRFALHAPGDRAGPHGRGDSRSIADRLRIVRNGQGHNEVGIRHDPTAHAEIADFRGTTLQPCGMASIWSKVGRIVFGAAREDLHRLYFEDRPSTRSTSSTPSATISS
jgi:hypothetical protein